MDRKELENSYREAVNQFRILASKEDKLLIFISFLRLICFTGGIIIVWIISLRSLLAGMITVLPLIVLFIYLLKIYSDHSGRKGFYNNLMKINLNEADAATGKTSQFEPGNSFINTSHDFSYDLDLFGESSLFQYLNRTVTGYGRDILSGWLIDPYSLSTDVKTRQEVIKELSGKEKWRHEFLASGMNTPLEKSHITDLLHWMEEDAMVKSSFKKYIIWVLPSVAILSCILLLTGSLHYSVFTFIFLLNLLYVAFGLRTTNKAHNALSGNYSYLSSFVKLFQIFENEAFNSKGLNNIKLNLSGEDASARDSVKKLSRLIQSFDSRMNIMVGFVLNGLLLWDYHCIYRLEKWKNRYRKFFPQWLEMIGNVDAYISLANYAFNNPRFAFPMVSENKSLLSAKMLGHPLIDDKKRVCNDFNISRSGSIYIITGANMAGKSTFLRTVAVNYILAMIGAPACALEMSFNPVMLFTSMRTTDSLSGNESYFYAELKRLKTLKSKIENGGPVLFILDEILKGTNSADKSLGSKLFMKKIILLGGTGLIATHDISLGDMEKDFPDSVVNMCFETEIDGELISFDYKLKNGITRKMNAALLMNQMGILD